MLRIAAKDLAIEWRSREVLATMTFLAVVVVLIFSFAFVVEGARTAGAGRRRHPLDRAGGLGDRRARRAPSTASATARPIRSLLLTPAPRAAIYLGKLAATVALMADHRDWC